MKKVNRILGKRMTVKAIEFVFTGLVLVMLILPSINAKSMTQAEYNRYNELTAQGYSPEVAWDQVQEEFHGSDGPFGTGGIDGKPVGGGSGGSGSGSGSGSSGTGGSGGGSKPAHTHEYVEEITKLNSCTEDGLKTFKCSCGKSYTEVLPAYGHDYQIDQSKHTDATCTELATETFVCQDCGDTFVQPYGELAEHDYKLASDSKEATCTEAGKLHWVCSVCGDEYFEDQEPLGHDWNKEYTIERSANCTEQGMKDIRCKRCNEVKTGSEMVIEATGHLENPSHTITEATAFKEGKEIITCMRCGEVISETAIPKTLNIPGLIAGCCVTVIIIFVVVVLITRSTKKKR